MKSVNLKITNQESWIILEALQKYYLEERTEYFKYLGYPENKETPITEKGEIVDGICNLIIREINFQED